jgi:transposase
MPMTFPFYPKLEHGCPNVSHCPHLGGAAIGTVVHRANENELHQRYLLGTIDAERERNSRLFAENQRLEKELEQVKLELKLERQNKFATNQQKHDKTPGASKSASSASSTAPGKKRGAPLGHPGWFRKTPTEYDWAVEVPPPKRCPHCNGHVTIDDAFGPSEHLQEDVIVGQYRVLLYRHPAACCDDCGEWVQQPGEGELLGSRIGPRLRSRALFLRHVIGISYRKIPQVVEEMFGITFTPAALIGFEKVVAELAQPLVADIAKKLASSDGAVHADETYSILDGKRAYFWVHGTTRYIHFTFGTTRSGKVSRDVLGDYFTGTLVTDCYSGYIAHTAGAKQKCLVHLARTARDWQKLTKAGSPDFAFFDAVKQFVRRGCEFHRLRGQGTLDTAQVAVEKQWLRDEQLRLERWGVSHGKALTLQARIVSYRDEWLVFVDDARVPPTNNLAEQALRPLVVLRKITFGHRDRKGGERMAALMSVAETARRHGHRASQIFLALMTHPPNKVLRQLYAKAAKTSKA